MESSKPTFLQMALGKPTWFPNKTETHGYEKGTCRQQRGLMRVGGRQRRVGAGGDQNALCTHMKMSKNKFN